ncbi:MAG: sensor histidine kinase, partial [Actinobacteria bacterium]|nr:sensor histidine kinase [Actinomycetota bacterium]
TPLTTVRAYADVLASQQSVEPEMRQRAQDRIAYESKRMTRLIDDLLLLARLSSTPLSDHELIDISSVISSHFHDLKVLDPSRKLTIDTTPCRVEADPALMDRLFANLSSNIHRHTPSSAEVAVRCVSDKGTVTCTIDDAGPGLDDSQLNLLAVGAERFSTLRSGDHHGTGLGLHLVASIARLHGGAATFERSPLGGLRVVVTLPTTHGRHSANDAPHHSSKDA